MQSAQSSALPLSTQCEMPRRFAALGMLNVTHIMPVLVLLSVLGVRMQQCMIRNYIFNIQHKSTVLRQLNLSSCNLFRIIVFRKKFSEDHYSSHQIFKKEIF